MEAQKKGTLFVFSGPSGVGKGLAQLLPGNKVDVRFIGGKITGHIDDLFSYPLLVRPRLYRHMANPTVHSLFEKVFSFPCHLQGGLVGNGVLPGIHHPVYLPQGVAVPLTHPRPPESMYL